MADEEKDWQLDALLDSLLRSYSAAEPRPGYETRLYAAVRAQATRTRRTNWLMFAASAAAVLLFAWMMITKTHTAKSSGAGNTVTHESPPARMSSGDKIVTHVSAPYRNRRAGQRPAEIRRSDPNRIVLQIVAATEGSGNLVFVREKLYLTPDTPPATAATTEEETQAPAVSIKAIGVSSIESNAPIEIKDLAPPKSSNEKGSL